MNINSSFVCGQHSECAALPADEWSSSIFSQVAFLAAQDAEPFCDRAIWRREPFTFVVPAIQMFGSINRRIE